MSAAVPALSMLAAFALAAGGIVLLRRREVRGKGALMLVAAAVLVANVVIWTI